MNYQLYAFAARANRWLLVGEWPEERARAATDDFEKHRAAIHKRGEGQVRLHNGRGLPVARAWAPMKRRVKR